MLHPVSNITVVIIAKGVGHPFTSHNRLLTKDQHLESFIRQYSAWEAMLASTEEAPSASPFEVGMRLADMGEGVATISFVPHLGLRGDCGQNDAALDAIAFINLDFSVNRYEDSML